jgi:hypothetical protein
MGLGSKVFLFFIIIILISNVILYLFTSEVYARSQERRAQQYSKDLIDQYIRSTDNYILNLDNIAHALMFNSTIQISLNDNRSRTQSDLFRERTYALNAIRLFEFGRSEIDISIFSQTDPFRFFTVNSNIAPAYDSRTDEWYGRLNISPKNKIMVYDNQQRYLAQAERRKVSTIAYKIWNVYTLENIGYLLIDIDMQYLKTFTTRLRPTSTAFSSFQTRASWSTRPMRSPTQTCCLSEPKPKRAPHSSSTTTGGRNGPFQG